MNKEDTWIEFTITNKEGKESKVYMSKEKWLALKEYEKELDKNYRKIWYNER